MISTLFALALTASAAQDLTIKRGAQEVPIAIVGATVHTVSGSAIADGFVLFDAGRIVAVGGGRPDLDGVTVIDAAGKHVWPGLVSPFTNLGLVEISAVRASADVDETGEVTPEVRAAVAVNPDSTLVPVTRSNGILTFATFPSGGLVPGRPGVMRVEGWTWEEMALEASAGLYVVWPSLRPSRPWWADEDEESKEDPLEAARKSLRRLEDLFDAAANYHRGRGVTGSNVTLDLGLEAMGEVLPRDGATPAGRVFVQADDLDQIRAAVEFCVRRGLAPVIVGGRDAGSCLELLVEHHVPVIVNGTYRMPKRDDAPYDEAFRLPAILEEAGVEWCLASGEETAHERNLPYAAALAVAYGLDEHAAVRAITLSAARILGVGDLVGSLEPGKLATLIITDGNPLDMTTKIERAFVDGRAIDLSNKQSKLAEKYREKYRQQRAADER